MANAQWRLLAVLIGIALFCVVVVGPAAATVPPTEPRNGLNESAFHALWSLEPNGELPTANTTPRQRRNNTDATFVTPPQTPERWNQNEIGRFKSFSGTGASVAPPDATFTQGQWIKDAYVSVFTVQPSTILHRTGNQTTRYVGQSGKMYATADYRIVLPDDTASLERRVSWSIDSHRVSDARLMIGGNIDGRFGRQQLSDASAGKVIRGGFSDAQRGMDELGVEADITTTLQKHIETRSCSTDDDGDISCSPWSSSYEYPSETLTVTDYINASYYTVQSDTYYTYNPVAQELRVVAGGGNPFNHIRLPDGDKAYGVWNYYIARDTTWDTLIESDPVDEPADKTVFPVEVHAYPSRAGAGTIGSNHTELAIDPGRADIYYQSGENYTPPTLPETVAVDMPVETYNTSRQLAVSHPVNTPSAVDIGGIVRGVDADLSPDDIFFTEIPTREPTITVSTTQLEESPHTRLAISLTDPNGSPIRTDLTEDSLRVAGETVETNADGEATVTLPEGQLPTQVIYQPTQFWNRGDVAYTAASTRVGSGVSLSLLISPIVRIIGILVFFWTPFYLLDRAFSGNYWPPWRGIF